MGIKTMTYSYVYTDGSLLAFECFKIVAYKPFTSPKYNGTFYQLGCVFLVTFRRVFY